MNDRIRKWMMSEEANKRIAKFINISYMCLAGKKLDANRRQALANAEEATRHFERDKKLLSRRDIQNFDNSISLLKDAIEEKYPTRKGE